MSLKAINSDNLIYLSQMYAFLGNSLLRPLHQTGGPGLDPSFWAELPDFNNDAVSAALERLCTFAKETQAQAEAGEDPATDVSVEYTRLFVGPPAPIAPPWETYYPTNTTTVPTSGFGYPTFHMKELLREVGLVLSSENHQFEDHIGIELLYLSVLADRAAKAEGEELDAMNARMATFIDEHPGRFIEQLEEKVVEAFPEGYIIRLLQLTKALFAL